MLVYKKWARFGVAFLVCTASFFFVHTILPPTVFATDFSGGLVSCGKDVSVKSGTMPDGSKATCTVGECTLCDVQITFLKLVDFFTVLASIFFSVMLMYAGWLFVSGGANTQTLAKAKGVLGSALMGFVVFLLAYIIVDTLMKVLYADTDTKWGPWKTFLCKNNKEGGNCVPVVEQASLVGVIYEPHLAGPEYGTADFEPTGDGTFSLKEAAYRDGVNKMKDASKCGSGGGKSCYDIVREAAIKAGIDPNFALAIATIESRGNAKTKPSSAGALGLMQIMPATGKKLCGTVCAGMDANTLRAYLSDPENSARLGTQYLRQIMDGKEGGDIVKLSGGDTSKTHVLAAMAYNAGPGKIKSTDKEGCALDVVAGCISETKGYANSVAKYMNL
jgi:hypothetical protein